ncbi:TPA: hypothetical protein DDX30_00775 [Candidatus Wolfebacteria bacterium]|nr:hypothetical protein [Candidatus Wolfebacteria bacterium]
MAIIFAAIAIVLFGSYAVVNRGEDSQQQVNEKSQPSLDGSSASGFLEDIGVSTDWLAAVTSEKEGDKNNVTESVALATFEQMKQLDQEGKNPFDEDTANSFAVQSSITRSVDTSTESLFATISVTDKDLKIIANNTQDAKKRYLSDLEAALARHPAKKSYENVEGGVQGLIERACAGKESGVGREMATTYTETADDVIRIQVPSQWAEFHRQIITHYRKGNIIFNSIANCYNDPLKGLLATQVLPDFIKNSDTLQKSLVKMYAEVGL